MSPSQTPETQSASQSPSMSESQSQSLEPLSLISANTSSPTVGGPMVVTGTGFAGTVGVTVNGEDCTGVTFTSDVIRCTIPEGVGTGYDIVVSSRGEELLYFEKFNYDPPVVDAVDPDSGSISGGTTVLIDGINFGTTLEDQVAAIDGRNCDRTIWLSDVQVICVTPIGDEPEVLVNVTVSVGGQTSVPNPLYTYLNATDLRILPDLGLEDSDLDVEIVVPPQASGCDPLVFTLSYPNGTFIRFIEASLSFDHTYVANVTVPSGLTVVSLPPTLYEETCGAPLVVAVESVTLFGYPAPEIIGFEPDETPADGDSVEITVIATGLVPNTTESFVCRVGDQITQGFVVSETEAVCFLPPFDDPQFAIVEVSLDGQTFVGNQSLPVFTTPPALRGIEYTVDLRALLVVFTEETNRGLFEPDVDRCFKYLSPASMERVGEFAVCLWLDGFVLEITLDRFPSPGEIITLQNDTIRKSDASRPFLFPLYKPVVASEPIILTRETLPVVFLNGPSVVAGCSAIPLTTTTVRDGFDPFYEWELVRPEANVLPEVAALLAGTNSSSVTFNTTILGSYFGELEYTVRVLSFIGWSEKSTLVTLRVDNDNEPSVSIFAHARGIPGSEQTHLQSTLSLPDCVLATEAVISYLWTATQSNGSVVALPADQVVNPELYIPAGTLSDYLGDDLTFSIVATVNGISSTPANVTLPVLRTALELRTFAPSEVAANQTFTVQADTSDPDGTAGVEEIIWRCNSTDLVFEELCVASLPAPSTFVESFNMSIPGVANYTIGATYVKDDGRRVSDEKFIIGLPSNATGPIVTLRTDSPGEYYVRTRLTLIADVVPVESTSTNFTYTWSVLPDTYIDLSQAAVVNVERSELVLEAGSLIGGLPYTFTVRVQETLSDGSRVSTFASLDLQPNQAPYGGSCAVTPTIGTALTTEFTIKCRDWEEALADLPVMYSFRTSYLPANATEDVFQSYLAQFRIAEEFTTVLPIYSLTEAVNVTVWSEMRDQNGDVTRRVQGIVVEPFGFVSPASRQLNATGTEASLADLSDLVAFELDTTFAALLQSFDYAGQLKMISQLSASLNLVAQFESESATAGLDDSVLAAVEEQNTRSRTTMLDAFYILSRTTGANLENVPHYGDVLADLVVVPEEFNVTRTDETAEILTYLTVSARDVGLVNATGLTSVLTAVSNSWALTLDAGVDPFEMISPTVDNFEAMLDNIHSRSVCGETLELTSPLITLTSFKESLDIFQVDTISAPVLARDSEKAQPTATLPELALLFPDDVADCHTVTLVNYALDSRPGPSAAIPDSWSLVSFARHVDIRSDSGQRVGTSKFNTLTLTVPIDFEPEQGNLVCAFLDTETNMFDVGLCESQRVGDTVECKCTVTSGQFAVFDVTFDERDESDTTSDDFPTIDVVWPFATGLLLLVCCFLAWCCWPVKGVVVAEAVQPAQWGPYVVFRPQAPAAEQWGVVWDGEDIERYMAAMD